MLRDIYRDVRKLFYYHFLLPFTLQLSTYEPINDQITLSCAQTGYHQIDTLHPEDLLKYLHLQDCC